MWVKFIEENKDCPFFIYLAHNMPHVKIDASAQFNGKSAGELYGDVVEEIDWNVGRILDLLKELKLEKNPTILFRSDNGSWSELEQR